MRIRRFSVKLRGSFALPHDAPSNGDRVCRRYDRAQLAADGYGWDEQAAKYFDALQRPDAVTTVT